ncbi:PIN domain-domain-containing protein [Syncephalastrum racemosum]|uniref:PIN domain-domain-containing protein n=1 Tax=Syncephalastrum racemosum TaxID=13706 RepID=A0A1X2HCE8_SYNRA|nr:PIN domain-domain-containing protein [Syncephalastrum racemosum]
MDDGMDLDGPEFLLSLSQEIADIRFQPDDTPINDDLFENGGGDTALASVRTALVLDTNFLISHLKYLKSLTQAAEEQPGQIVLIIPWIVVRELDRLKLRHEPRSENGVFVGTLSDLARKAMQFIEKALRKQKHWLRGQKQSEVYDKDSKLVRTMLLKTIMRLI